MITERRKKPLINVIFYPNYHDRESCLNPISAWQWLICLKFIENKTCTRTLQTGKNSSAYTAWKWGWMRKNCSRHHRNILLTSWLKTKYYHEANKSIAATWFQIFHLEYIDSHISKIAWYKNWLEWHWGDSFWSNWSVDKWPWYAQTHAGLVNYVCMQGLFWYH